METGSRQLWFLDRKLSDLDAEELAAVIKHRFPGIEVVVLDSHRGQIFPVAAGLGPSFVRRILDGLRQFGGEHVVVTSPVLLCSTPARFHLERLPGTVLAETGGAVPRRNSSHCTGAGGGHGGIERGLAFGRSWLAGG